MTVFSLSSSSIHRLCGDHLFLAEPSSVFWLPGQVFLLLLQLGQFFSKSQVGRVTFVFSQVCRTAFGWTPLPARPSSAGPFSAEPPNFSLSPIQVFIICPTSRVILVFFSGSGLNNARLEFASFGTFLGSHDSGPEPLEPPTLQEV